MINFKKLFSGSHTDGLGAPGQAEPLFQARQVASEAEQTRLLVEEIHETFYTEVDRLLAEAKIQVSEDTEYKDLIEKAVRLEKLGFKNTKECKEAEGEIKRLRGIHELNLEKKALQEAIAHFSTRYPHYKFITEESVKKICEKYGLVYGPADKYTGTVPEKNLKHMESFCVLKEDECWERFYVGVWGTLSVGYTSARLATAFGVEKDIYCALKPLEIAVPVSDFDTKGMEIKDRQLVRDIPDPVVLKPVYFGGHKHYLIVTAWGAEASDELVVNEKMN